MRGRLLIDVPEYGLKAGDIVTLHHHAVGWSFSRDRQCGYLKREEVEALKNCPDPASAK